MNGRKARERRKITPKKTPQLNPTEGPNRAQRRFKTKNRLMTKQGYRRGVAIKDFS